MPENRRPHRRSLRSKLIPLTILAAILPALLVGALLVAQQTRARERQTYAHLTDLAGEVADRLSDLSARTDSVLSTLASTWSFATARANEEQFTLRVILKGHNAFREFVVLDATGKPTLHLSEGRAILPAEMTNWTRRPEWRAFYGQSYTGKVFQGPEGDPNYIRALPIRGPSGSANGVLVVRISIEEISRILARARTGNTGHAYVVDRDGILIAHSNPRLARQQIDLSQLPIIQAALRGERPQELMISTQTELGTSEPYIMVYDRARRLGWIVVEEQAYREALLPNFGRLALIGLLTLALVVLFALVSTRLVAGIVGPIRELERGAEIIGRGNYDYRLNIHTDDEVEELAAEFNRMAERVRASREDLLALNQVGQQIASQLEPSQTWRVLTEGASQLSGAECALGLAPAGNNESPSVVSMAIHGVGGKICSEPDLRNSREIAALVSRETAPFRINDLHLGPESHPELSQIAGRMRSALWVPLLGKNRKLLGGILLFHSAPGFFSIREEQLVVSLASQAAVGLENARLFHQVEEERYNLQAIFDSMAEGVLVLDNDTRIIHANQIAADIIGVPVSEIEGKAGGLSSFGVRDMSGRTIPLEELPGTSALRTGEVVLGREMLIKTPDLGDRVLSVSGAVLKGTQGAVLGAVVTFRDITEIKEAEQELRRALESERRAARELTSITNVVQALTSTLDLAERLHIAAESLAGAVGVQRCIILLVEGDHITPMTVYGGRRDDGALVNLIPDRLSDYKPESILLEAVRQLRPIVVKDAGKDPRLTTPLARLLGMRSLLLVPIVYQGETIGLAFIDQPEQPREFSDREVRLAMAIAGQAGAIIAESKLLEETEARARELDTLFNVARAVVSVIELQRVLDTVVEQTRNVMDVDAVSLMLTNETLRVVEMKAWRGLSEEHVQKSGLRIGDGIAGRVAADGVPRSSLNIQIDPEYRLRDVVRREGLRSMLSVPIAVRHQVIGVINLFTKDTREFSSNDITLVSTIASLAGTAIRNATVYERERHIAETLQTSLLPAELPEFPAIRLGYRYEPAAAEARVGGDFYDFFHLPDGRWGMMVGDVSGHGVGAAVNTALVKYALRAYAYENPDPSVALAKLNDAVSRQMELGTFITVLYAVLDPEQRVLQISNGGHPFAVHYVAATAECQPVETAGMAVGILPGQNYLETTMGLSTGDLLVLFTDGVTEAGPVEHMLGMEGVIALIRENHGLGAQEVAEAIYRRILEISGGITTDDVALLVLKAV